MLENHYERGEEVKTIFDFLRSFKEGTKAVFFIRHAGYFNSDMIAPLEITDWEEVMQLISEGGRIWPRVEKKREIVFGDKEDLALEAFINDVFSTVSHSDGFDCQFIKAMKILKEKVSIKYKEK